MAIKIIRTELAKDNEVKQSRVCKKICTAHLATPFCALQALRHSYQQLEAGKVAGLTVKRKRTKARSYNKNNAAQMSLLQNRYIHNH